MAQLDSNDEHLIGAFPKARRHRRARTFSR
jgi:hypothetical protein